MKVNNEDYKVLYILGVIPVIWLALLVAPLIDNNFIDIIVGITKSLNNPFNININNI